MKFFALLLSSLLLTACGGGGGGGAPASAGPVASTSTFQLKQAYINDFNATGSLPFKASGLVFVNPNTPSAQTVSVTGSGAEVSSPLTAATFENAAALQRTTTVTGTLTATASTGATTTLPLNTTGTSFVRAGGGYEPLGSTSVGGGTSSYSVASGLFTLPATAKVGDSGGLADFLTYASSAKTAVTGSTLYTWALEADTASTAILKITSTTKDATGKLTSLTKTYRRLTPVGTVTQISSDGETYDAAGNVTLKLTTTY